MTPTAQELRPGIWALRISVPSLTVGSANCYLVRAPDGDVLVDTAHAEPAARDGLAAALRLAGSDPLAIRGVVLTHGHYDHSGNAIELRRGGAWLAVHARDREWLTGGRAQGDTEDAVHALCLRSGIPAAELPVPYAAREAVPPVGAELEHIDLGAREVLDLGGVEAVVLATPGHTAGHIALAVPERGVVLTGDTLFARGSAVHFLDEEPDAPSDHDPVGDSLATFDRLAELADLLALPGHGEPVTDVRQRAGEVRDRSLHRLDAVAGALDAEPLTVWEIAGRVPWGFEWERAAPARRRAGLLSTVAYLRTLYRQGRVRRVPDPDVLRYTAA